MNDPAQVPDLVTAPAVTPAVTAETAFSKEQLRSEVRTETAVTPEPDRCCWPDSSAMNGAEIDTFTARLNQFTRRGLAEPEVESLADKLLIRDRESDDRRLCLECLHLKSGGGRWGCNQWQRAGLGAAGLPADLVRQLQRCDSFKEIRQ